MAKIFDATPPSSSSHSLPTRLPSALLQTCASFLAFRQQRRLVATCAAVAHCIDHPASVAYAFEAEYPARASAAAAGDSMMARLVRNRTPRLTFWRNRAGTHQSLLGHHLTLMCSAMPQLTSLRVTLGAFVSKWQLNHVLKLPLLAHLDLTFEHAPSLSALVDGFRVAPCAKRIVLGWRDACSDWDEILTIGMLLSAQPPSSPAPSPAPSSRPPPTATLAATWRPDPTYEAQRARVIEWLCDYKTPRGLADGHKAFSALSALAEISVACPALEFDTVLTTMPLLVAAASACALRDERRARGPVALK